MESAGIIFVGFWLDRHFDATETLGGFFQSGFFNRFQFYFSECHFPNMPKITGYRFFFLRIARVIILARMVRVPPDDLSSFAGPAAAVSFQWSPVPGTNGCIGDFGMQMSQSSFTPLTCCEPPPGLVGSHFMDETQMQRTPAGEGTEAGHARSW